MKCISKLYRSLFNALPLALSFAAGTALAVDLPANYTRLDWIESDASGLQWIDSGYSPNSDTVIRASILAKAKRVDWAVFFGIMSDDKPNYSVVFRYFNNSNFNGIFCNSNYAEAGIPSTANMEYEVELKSGSLTVTGSAATIKTITTGESPVNAPIYIFCQNKYASASETSSPDRHQPMRLYSMTISEGNVPKRDFIPCIDDSGAYGLWDTVGGTFYGNKASGADFTGGVIYEAAANEKLTVQDASGTIELRGADAATSEVEVQALAAGSLVYVVNNLKAVAIGSVGSGVNIVVRKIPSSDASVTLALPAGQMIESLTIEEGLTVCLESGSVGSFEGTGRLVVQGAVGYGTISGGIDVSVESNGAMTSLIDDVAATVLGDLPALWLDASDETTLQEYTYNNHTVPEGTFPGIVVRRWDDVRGGVDRYYAVNARSSTGNSDGGFIRTMPYSVTNALNGLTVLSFGTRGGKVYDYQDAIDNAGRANGGSGGHDEQRRMIFNKPIASKTVVMVYGSHDGGGRGLIGGWKDSGYGEAKNPIEGETIEKTQQDTYYNRTYTTTDDTILAAGRINVPFWADGAPVVPNETAALNGAYQILSMGVAPGDSPSLRSLGMDDTYLNAGGQRYGEILIFTNELTTVQRKAVEFYLAKKWGLTEGFCAGGRPRSLEVADGGSFETVDSVIDIPHSGGSLSVGGALEASGVVVGSVSIAAGASLTLPGKDPYTEEQVDAIEGRIARFDPDCTDDVGFNNTSNMVHALFGHGNKDVADTPYLQAYYNDANNDRRPTYSRGARGFGPERGWMDLYADPPDKTRKGNNLRLKTNHDQWKGNNSETVKQNVKTAFIVMDSCHGGGLPIIDKVAPDNGTAVRARSSYSDYTAPIWGSGTSSILTGGETRINGRKVDGTTTGFTGAPELFSFTTDGNAFQAGFFGLYNAGSDPEQAYEVFGEILLFSEVLDVASRGEIEAYLMKKWLNMLPPGYADWTGATITGAGTVKAGRLKDLPQFENFTGTLEFTAPTLAFTLDGATKSVAEAFDIGGATLRLAAEGEIALSFADGLAKPGSYTLATFGTLAEPGITNWTYPSRTLDDKYKIRISATNGALVAEVVSPGMCIILR